MPFVRYFEVIFMTFFSCIYSQLIRKKQHNTLRFTLINLRVNMIGFFRHNTHLRGYMAKTRRILQSMLKFLPGLGPGSKSEPCWVCAQIYNTIPISIACKHTQKNWTTSLEKKLFSCVGEYAKYGFDQQRLIWYMFVACAIWCLADVSSVSPSSEQTHKRTQVRRGQSDLR